MNHESTANARMNNQLDLGSYKHRLEELRNRCAGHFQSKHLLCSNFIYLTKTLNENAFNEHCAKVINKDGDADFVMISLIRLLYLIKVHSTSLTSVQLDVINRIAGQVLYCLDVFPFWPNIGKSSGTPDDMVFWSENHIFMLLTTHYLFKQFQRSYTTSANDGVENDHDIFLDNLLKTYIRAHLKFNSTSNSKGVSTSCGLYEVLSHVYLPYTFSALLNLFDFCGDAELKSQSAELIDCIVTQLMVATTADGICNLSVSNRAFLRTRTRVHGHNINQLIQLISGQILDVNPCSQLTDFLLTTTWFPNVRHFEAYKFSGFLQLTMNHSIEDTRQIFLESATEVGLLQSKLKNEIISTINNSNNSSNTAELTKDDTQVDIATPISLQSSRYFTVDPIELTPFYWSAGLVSHPGFIRDTQKYQDLKQLQNNCHLWPLRMLPPSVVRSLLQSYHHFSRGQDYTGVVLNIYKSSTGGLSLTSYQTPKDTESFCGFQQLPWIANISGIGVWSQSGDGTESISKFGLTNTHSPYISQHHNILISLYSAPAALTATLGFSSNMFSYKVRMFWPNLAFEQEMSMFHKSDCFETTVVTESNYMSRVSVLMTSSFSFSSSSSSYRNSSNNNINNSRKRNSQDNKLLWRVARYKSSLIGVMCSDVTTEDNSSTKDSLIEVANGNNSRRITSTRLVCRAPTHFWVVKVGTIEEFSSLAIFLESCVSMKIIYKENKFHRITITVINNTIQTSEANSQSNYNDSLITRLECVRPTD